MKKNRTRILFVAILVVSLFCTTVNALAASNNVSEISKENLINEKYILEEVASITYNDDTLQDTLNACSVDNGMTAEALQKLDKVSDIRIAAQLINNDYFEVTYTFYPNEPSKVIIYESGNKEEIVNVSSYTYTIKNINIIDDNLFDIQANSTGNYGEYTQLSDVTFYNSMTYSYYYYNTSFKAAKMTKASTKITKFLESDLRNLKLSATCWGDSDNGPCREYSERTAVTSPSLNTTYSFTPTCNNYYLVTASGALSVNSQVTYNHGNSSYTVSSQLYMGGI